MLLSLWISASSSSAVSVVEGNNQDGKPSSFSFKKHPIWIEPSELKIKKNIQLMSFPSQSTSIAKHDDKMNSSSYSAMELKSEVVVTKQSNEENTACINLLAKELKIIKLPKSFMKSVKAKDCLIW
jgi:hypothetical protein